MKWSCLAVAGGLLIATVTSYAADWRDELASQMQREHGCEVVLFSRVSEHTIGNRRVVSARVHCADERRFDAQRDRALARFQVRQCEPTQSC